MVEKFNQEKYFQPGWKFSQIVEKFKDQEKKEFEFYYRQYGLWMNFKFMRIRIMIFFFFFLEDGFGCGQLFGYSLGRGWWEPDLDWWSQQWSV